MAPRVPFQRKPRVILTRRWPAAVESVLAEEFDLERNDADLPMDAAGLADALARADALCPTVTDTLDAALLDKESLRVGIVANFGVGYNHIDLDIARVRSIVVTNTPGVLTECTADLTMTLALMTARRAGEGEREVRQGAWTGWRPTHMLGRRVSGKTLGIVGAGRIGMATARRAKFGFGMTPLFAEHGSLSASDVAGVDGEIVPLDDLLGRADFVSLHCPSTPANHHLIDAHKLAAMRRDGILINTARGDIVDEGALAAALGEGVIGGAGLDVYEAEPRLLPALLDAPNVVLLPHLGSATVETRTAMGMCVVNNLRSYFAGETPPNVVSG